MICHERFSRFFLRALLLASAAAVVVVASAAPTLAQPSAQLRPAQTGDRIQADNACFIRLADMPQTANRSGRYGMFGGYNPQTGVLVAAGGAYKATDENTITYSDLFGIRLDGGGAWSGIGYGSGVGYSQEADQGCREMASVQLSNTNWASVFGKDGCDNGRFDTTGKKGGDIKEVAIGDKASATGVRWVGNSGASALPKILGDNKGKLTRAFAAWDARRNRIIIGQGTFDDEVDNLSQDNVYAAAKSGSQFQVTELRPGGTPPVKRFGACAAYVYDAASGVDGVIVLGGQQGGPERIPATSYKEVWWLDFSKSASGQWQEITGRFANMNDFGYRREGACAYDTATKTFYSWMGRADSKVPDGASHSAGVWRVNLAALGDATAQLTWERLAKDNTSGIKGRRLIPSVWDPANKRMFVVGGRNGNDALLDTWVIYPDVTGAACTNLDPYAPFRAGVPTPTQSSPGATNTPGSGPTVKPPTPVPATPIPDPKVCDFITSRVPGQVINDAMGNKSSVAGYDMLCNPKLPASNWNVKREFLSLMAASKPYHPVFNTVIWKCGCP
jgi:hypothetical protein